MLSWPAIRLSLIAVAGFAARLDGDPVIRDARDDGEWIDFTSRLKEGNAPIGLRIHNDHGGCTLGRAEILP
jgi:hypothetical protein